MSAPTIGQLVFVARPQVQANSGDFDAALVLANLGAGVHVPATAYQVDLLLFSTDHLGNIKPITVTAELYPDRATAASQAPGSLTAPQSASVV